MRDICIIGSLNTEIILGPAEDLPAWGSQILVSECERRSAGSAACVALPLAALGVQSAILASVGDDDAGRAILERLRESGLATDSIRIVKTVPTGICISIFAKDGERLYVSSLGAIHSTTRETLDAARLRESDVVLLTGLFVLPGLGLSDAATWFEQLKRAGKTTCLDTGWDSTGWNQETIEGVRRLLKSTDVFLPNALEARTITGKHPIADAARTLREMGPRTVIVKCDRDGAVGWFDNDFLEDPGFPTRAHDTTAAGEAFNAGVLYALREGFDPTRTLSFANAVAATFLARKGGYGTLPEVCRLIEERATR